MESLKFVSIFLLAAFGLGTVASADPGGNSSRSVLIAQNTGKASADSTALPNLSSAPDTLAARYSRDVQPKTALYHSMILPGWGQYDNGRKKKALLFIAAELGFLGGALYEQYLLSGNNRTPFEKDVARTDRNTFIMYWLGARVFGLVDAYVDAHMKGFNTDNVAPPGLARPSDNP